MQTRISSLGNGNDIRINKPIMEALKLKINDSVDITAEKDAIVIKKLFTHKTLEQRVADSGKPLVSYGEYDFGEACKGEYWWEE